VAKNPRERERERESSVWFWFDFCCGGQKKKASKWMMEGECKERELWTAFFGVLVWAR
jgi:hypothetical protein